MKPVAYSTEVRAALASGTVSRTSPFTLSQRPSGAVALRDAT